MEGMRLKESTVESRKRKKESQMGSVNRECETTYMYPPTIIIIIV